MISGLFKPLRSSVRLISSCLLSTHQQSIDHSPHLNNITAICHTCAVSVHSAAHGGRDSRKRIKGLQEAAFTMSILGLFKKHKEDEDEDDEGKVPISFKRQYVMAQMNLTDRNYQAAESNYHKALEILQRSPLVSTEPYIEAMAVITYELGELYIIREDWDKATSNYIETINLMSQCNLSMESPPIIALSLKLGKTLTNKKDYQEAEKTFNFTLSSAKTLVATEATQENLALLGMCYHVKAQFHLMSKDFKQALLCFSLALDTAKKVYDEDDIQIAVLMSDCSTALEGLACYKEAETLLQDAIKLSLSLPQPHDHEHLATLLMNLAAVKNSQGLRDESVEVYKKAQSYAVNLMDKSIHNEIKRRINLLKTKST